MVPTELLARFPCFHAATADTLDALARITRRVELDAGTALFRQGDVSDQLYVIVSGTVEVRQTLGESPEMVVDVVGSGDLIGWSAMASPYLRRSSCIALDRAVVLGLEAAGLREVCTRHPEFGFELMSLVSQTISRRLAGAWGQIALPH